MSEPRVMVSGVGLVCPQAGSARELVATAHPRSPHDPAWFDPVPDLGRYGWKYFSAATRFLLAAASRGLANAGLPNRAGGTAKPDWPGPPADAIGVVVGTNFAAARPLARFDHTTMAEGAEALSPAEAPTFSVNIPASQISLRFGFRAFNLTLTNPVVAGLESMVTLADAIRDGRATAGVAGATEELPDVPTGHSPAGEGACCLVMERDDALQARGARPLAELRGGFSRFLPADGRPGPPVRPSAADDWSRALGQPLVRLLAGCADEVPIAVLPGPFAAEPVLAYCQAVCRQLPLKLVSAEYPGADGGYFALSPLLAVAGLLEEHGHGLVVGVSPHGHVAGLHLSAAGPVGAGESVTPPATTTVPPTGE